jgi:CHAT domain-containing protein
VTAPLSVLALLAAAPLLAGLPPADESPATRPFDHRLIDALLAGGGDAARLVAERPDAAFEIFHAYLDAALRQELEGDLERARLGREIARKLAPLLDAVSEGDALASALACHERLRHEGASRKAAADQRLRAAEEALARGDSEGAERESTAAAAEYAALGDWRGGARAHHLLGSAGKGERGAEALADLEEAARLYRAAGDLWKAPAVLMELGEARQLRGEHRLSGAAYGEAMAGFERIGRTEDAWLARSRLATVLVSLGSLGEALRHLEACEEHYAGGYPPARAHVAAEIGAALLAAGAYGEAFERFLEAADMVAEDERFLRERARILLRLAGACDELGLYQWAEKCLDEASELEGRAASQASAGEPAGGGTAAACAAARARVALDRGRLEEAAALAKAELETTALAGGLPPPSGARPDPGAGPHAAELLRVLAAASGERDAGAAAVWLRDARARCREAGDRLGEGLAAVELAEALRRSARPEDRAEAETLCREALERQAELPEVAWRAHVVLGALAEERGEIEPAFASYRRAIKIEEGILSRVRAASLRAGFFEGRERPYHRLVALLAARGEAREALAVAQRLQGRAAEARGHRAALALVAPDLLARRRALAARLESIARKLDPPPEPRAAAAPAAAAAAAVEDSERAALLAERAALRREYHGLLAREEAAQAEARPGGPAREGGAVAIEAVQEALRGGSSSNGGGSSGGRGDRGDRGAVLVYLVTRERLHLWTIGDHGLGYRALPIGEEELHRRVGRLHGPFASFREGQVDLSHLEFDARAARELFSLLIEPALPELEGVSGITIVPDGPLHHLPFEALVASGTPGEESLGRLFVEYRGLEFLVERWAVTYAPSLRSLTAPGAAPPGALERALVLADPGRPEPRRGTALRAARRGPLPLAREEAAAIRDLLGAGRVTLLEGEAATEEALAANLPGAGILHLAAHAWVDDDAPLFSGVALHNGVLEAHEARGLDIAGKLVVLSGCETAGGPLRRGEGLESLARQFLDAGARGVVASLWRVDDSTAHLMRRFYRELEAGAPAAEALRRAKVHLLRELESERFVYALPFFWAPFVLIAAPRS